MWKFDYQLYRHTGDINCIDISPDITFMVTASSDCSVCYTNLQTRKSEFLKDQNQPLYSVSVSPNSKLFASCSNTGDVTVWNVDTLEKAGQYKAHQLLARTICWSPDGAYIATGSNDQNVAIYSLKSFTRRHVFHALNGWVRSIKWQDSKIAVVGNSHSIEIWDPRAPKKVLSIDSGAQGDLSSVSFHHSGFYVGTGSFDNLIRIHDLRNLKLAQRFCAHTSAVTNVAFNPYTEDFLSVGRDCMAKIWDLKTAQVTATFTHHTEGILGCCWQPTSRGFVTCGKDQAICSYRLVSKPLSPSDLPMDDGDVFESLERIQDEITKLARTMKSIEKRLLLQEEKLQWLSDVDVTKAMK